MTFKNCRKKILSKINMDYYSLENVYSKLLHQKHIFIKRNLEIKEEVLLMIF